MVLHVAARESISGPGKISSSTRKDFFNCIRQRRTHATQQAPLLFNHPSARVGSAGGNRRPGAKRYLSNRSNLHDL